MTNYLFKLENISVTKFENITKKEAILYIDEVKNRARGFIKSPYLEVLLKYQYFDHPESELANNHYKIYSVTNYSNSIKTELHVNIPKSWKELSSKNSTQILKTFRSELGNGKEIITIAKKTLTKSTLTGDLSIAKEIQKMIPKSAQKVASASNFIHNRLVHKVQYLESNTTIKPQLKRYVFLYAFEYKGLLILVNCSLYDEVNNTINKERFEPLFQAILSSIKLRIEPFGKNIISSYKQ